MRAQKRDANEADIVETLQMNGYLVERHYAPDPFDLLVSRIGSPLALRVEVKTAKGTLTEAQERALAGKGIVVVRDAFDALRHCEAFL